MSVPDSPEAPRRPRVHNKPCTYTVQERAAIQPFRKRYQNEESKQARIQMMRTEIMPALFDYWEQRGDPPQTNEESTKSVQVN